MLFHMLYHTVDIAKETHMTKLIHLIMTDGLDAKLFLNINQVILGSCNGCNTRAWEADLGSRCKFINHIRVTGSLTLC